MKNSSLPNIQLHPMVIFWLGILTGALVVGLIFFYRAMSPYQYSSDILRSDLDLRSTLEIDAPLEVPVEPAVDSLRMEETIDSRDYSTDYDATFNEFPTPPGGMTAFPTPPGG